MDEIELRVNGRIYSGWSSMTVTRAMDAAAGGFSLELTERWYEGQRPQLTEPWPILPGDAAEIRIGADTVISGYVDAFRPSFSGTSHTISIQGRDKTADLIDCSAVHAPDEWRNLDLLGFAKVLAAPFGVPVSAEVPVGDRFQLLKLQQGETALDAIVRYAKQRQVLLMPDGSGGLLLTRAGARRAAIPLVQGENILDASGALDHSQRFSRYLVKAQTGFSLESTGETEAHLSGSVADPGVGRYRPLLIVAEAGGSGASVAARAAWEANVRIGRSASATITVQGWRQSPGGSLWAPNLRVPVRCPWLRLDAEMIIRQCTFNRGDGGTTTKLDLVSPQTYAPEPPTASTAGGSGNPWAGVL